MSFKVVVRQMLDEELRLLILRDADMRRRVGQTKTFLVLGTALGLLIAAAARWSVKSDSSKRGLAEEALRDQEEKFRAAADPRKLRQLEFASVPPKLSRALISKQPSEVHLKIIRAARGRMNANVRTDSVRHRHRA